MKTITLIVLIFSCASVFAGSTQWNQAYEAYQSKNWDQAIELFEKIPPKSSEYANAQRYIGYNIYGRALGKWSLALAHCVNAYHKDPTNPKVLEDLERACKQRRLEL